MPDVKTKENVIAVLKSQNGAKKVIKQKWYQFWRRK